MKNVVVLALSFKWQATKEADQAGITAHSGHADLVLLPSRRGLSPGVSLTYTF